MLIDSDRFKYQAQLSILYMNNIIQNMNNIQRQIVQQMRSKPDETPTIRSLAKEIETSYSTVWRNIQKLEKQDVLTLKTVGGSKICQINTRLRKYTERQAEQIADSLSYKVPPGLIAAATQDWLTGEILMVAFMNPEAVRKTLTTGTAHYWSRSRKTLWMKGETSGHIQTIKDILVDCDEDTLTLQIEQKGAACHTGNRSCFYREIGDML